MPKNISSIKTTNGSLGQKPSISQREDREFALWLDISILADAFPSGRVPRLLFVVTQVLFRNI
jgi:hypothetical protein